MDDGAEFVAACGGKAVNVGADRAWFGDGLGWGCGPRGGAGVYVFAEDGTVFKPHLQGCEVTHVEHFALQGLPR